MNLGGYVFRKGISENVATQKYDFERRLQDLQIFKKLYVSQMNPKELYTQFNYLHSRSYQLDLKGL